MEQLPSRKLLELRDISKSYPGVHALHPLDLDLDRGEVVGVIGENGAGKSTLVKILGGAHQADAGTIRLSGRPVNFSTPNEASANGISVIYQEFNLIPFLNAVENIFLGQPVSRWGWINTRKEHALARSLLENLGIQINLKQPVSRLSIAQQQAIEIAKALVNDSKLLILDEPTATLSPVECEKLFSIIDRLRGEGLGIIYISHRLEEISRVAQRVVVLRDGEMVADQNINDLTRESMIELMVGRKLENEFPKRDTKIGACHLAIKNLGGDRLAGPSSFKLNRGEVLGITGLVGAGRTELARLIFGADQKSQGEIELDGRQLHIHKPIDAIQAGICLLTEDRKTQGLIVGQSVVENFGLPNSDQFSTSGFLNRKRESRAFIRQSEQLKLKHYQQSQAASALSGGNQQKLVLAKWLQRQCEVFLLDEPTRGIDVGAKYEVYQLINELVGGQKSVILISSELPEVLGMCDRILVMKAGKITGEICDVANADQEQIMEMAT